MTKYNQIEEMIKKNNGYLFTSEVEQSGISRTYMHRFVNENGLEMVAKGIYVTEDTWADQLYILQISNPRVIFSGETGLFLNMLTDREYSEICVSVPEGHNGSRLRDRGVVVHQEKRGIYGLGLQEIQTNYGNLVRTYDKERCICDTVRNRSKFEVQTYQTALRNYMRGKDKDLSRLVKYGEALNIRDEIMKYVEVMV